jgi:hypothetical protein
MRYLHIDDYPSTLVIFIGPSGTHIGMEQSKPTSLSLLFYE